MQAEKSALSGNIDLQAAETRKLKAEMDSSLNVISEQDLKSTPDRKRLKEVDIYGGLELRCVDVVIEVLRTLSVRFGVETAELCPFDAFRK